MAKSFDALVKRTTNKQTRLRAAVRTKELLGVLSAGNVGQAACKSPDRSMKFELNTFNRNATDEDLLKDLVAADAKLKMQGKGLTFRSYREFGNYSPTTINVRFGSWNNGLRKAGLIPSEEKNVSVEALFDNLKLVWIAKGRQPVYRDMSVPPSQYTGSTYSARFGGRRKALAEFVAASDQERYDLLIQDVAVEHKKIIKRTNRDPSLALRFLVLKRDSFCCVACGRSPATVAGLVLEIDHILAWTRGGETVADNLQTLCFDCNRGKSVT
jgi:HNH endonuclease/Homing endonuclease associated repeat